MLPPKLLCWSRDAVTVNFGPEIDKLSSSYRGNQEQSDFSSSRVELPTEAQQAPPTLV